MTWRGRQVRPRDAAMVALVALTVLRSPAAVTPADPFAFFQPTVTLTAEDRRQLDRGEPVAWILPGADREVGVFAAIPVHIDGDRLVAWVRRIDALKRSSYVPAIHRFSDPPRIEDLVDLVLDEDELSEVRGCRPGRCAMNLSSDEVAELRRTTAAEGASLDTIQQAFWRIVLQRARIYVGADRAARDESVERGASSAEVLARLVNHSVFLQERLPRLANDLGRARPSTMPGAESFLYWSKERLAGKPIIGITDVTILRSREPGFPDVLVAGKQFFATHYINSSLGLTALVRGEPNGSTYLVYLNRSDVDVLSGMFGSLIRWFVQRRLRTEAADILRGLRQRLESGEPTPLPGVDRLIQMRSPRRADVLH